MMIPQNRLDRGFLQYQAEFEEAALRVLRSGWYVNGAELDAFERAFAARMGAKECVGLGNGLDALWIAFRILGVGQGDEVLVAGNAYIACVMGVTINGATPVFVEPDEYYNIDPARIEAAITPRTKAILAVHLYGQACAMDAIMEIAARRGLTVVEDCAQSHGATFGGRTTGAFGAVGCFSFYPSKNLGAFGDGGAIVTDDPALAEKARMIRNYGSRKRYYNEVVGANSRLDEMQAALLSVRLKHFDEITAERETLAARYTAGIRNELVALPRVRPGATSVWHQYVVRAKERDALLTFLKERGIGTLIHYPVPPHLSEAYAYLGFHRGDFPVAERYADECLSLPMFSGMTEEEQRAVIDAVNAFTGGEV